MNSRNYQIHGKKEVALEMLKDDFSIEVIEKVPQLDREETEKLKSDSKR